MTNKEIKNKALDCISINWLKPLFVICCILTLFIIIALLESAGISLFQRFGLISADEPLMSNNTLVICLLIVRYAILNFAVSPMILGAIWWFLHFVRDSENPLSVIFISFTNLRLYFRCVLLAFLKSLILLFSLTPATITAYSLYQCIEHCYSNALNNSEYIILIICFAVLTILFSIFSVIVNIRFLAVSFLFVYNPDFKICYYFKKSYCLMKNNTLKVVKFFLSFCGWIIPSLFIFPLFFIVPYFAMSLTIFMNEIIDKNRKESKEINFCKYTRPFLQRETEI